MSTAPARAEKLARSTAMSAAVRDHLAAIKAALQGVPEADREGVTAVLAGALVQHAIETASPASRMATMQTILRRLMLTGMAEGLVVMEGESEGEGEGCDDPDCPVCHGGTGGERPRCH